MCTAPGRSAPSTEPHTHAPPALAAPPLTPESRTKWTRRVLHPVRIGHAASLTPESAPTARPAESALHRGPLRAARGPPRPTAWGAGRPRARAPPRKLSACTSAAGSSAPRSSPRARRRPAPKRALSRGFPLMGRCDGNAAGRLEGGRGGTRRVRLVRGEGRGVSSQYEGGVLASLLESRGTRCWAMNEVFCHDE